MTFMYFFKGLVKQLVKGIEEPKGATTSQKRTERQPQDVENMIS